MFGKSTRAELEIQNEELKKAYDAKKNELTKAQNQIAMLLANAKRWSRKFQDPLYSVPTKVIAQMEQETEQYKQRTRAQLDEFAIKNAILMQKVVELKNELLGKNQDDTFGDAAGNKDMDFVLVTNHENAHITPEDRENVELELNKMMQAQLAKHADKSKP